MNTSAVIGNKMPSPMVIERRSGVQKYTFFGGWSDRRQWIIFDFLRNSIEFEIRQRI